MYVGNETVCSIYKEKSEKDDTCTSQKILTSCCRDDDARGYCNSGNFCFT